MGIFVFMKSPWLPFTAHHCLKVAGSSQPAGHVLALPWESALSSLGLSHSYPFFGS